MTAEEILREWLIQTDQTNLKEGHYFVIQQAMKEFATLKCKELLEIVAKKAEIEWEGMNDCTDMAHINKDSILNAVDLNEFIK